MAPKGLIMMKRLEQPWTVLTTRSPRTRQKSAEVRRRRRRPILEDLEPRRLLSGIDVFPASKAQVIPWAITTGPDGNIWFTQSVGNGAIGVLNPTTRVVTEIPLPSSVGFEGADHVSITAGPDGNIWFADYDGNTIGKIDPATDAITVYTVPTANAGLEDITAGPHGNLWFIEKAANQVGMINPTTGAITEFPVPTANSWLDSITTGPDGNLWFTEQVGNKIGMIDPTTGAITEFAIPTAESSPSAITAGPDGNLWFIESGAIGTINPTTDAITQFPIPTETAGTILESGVITAGPDGNLWFGYFNGDNVGSINPTTDAVTQYHVPLAQPGLNGIGGPGGITAGPDGNIWITLSNADQIGVFDPQTIGSALTGPTTHPNIVSPPSEPLTSATPGTPFGFTLTLAGSAGQANSGPSGTITLALPGSSGGGILDVTTRDGVDTESGLTLKRLADGPRYALIAHVPRQTATPKGPAVLASTRSVRIATEETLTAGKGKDKHVVGFKIDLSRSFDRTMARIAHPAGASAVQPVNLVVDYGASGGTSVMLAGKARIARGGQVIIVARS